MPELRITRTAQFDAVCAEGKIYQVEEYTYLGGGPVNFPTRTLWEKDQRFYLVNEDVQPVDLVSENTYMLRRTGKLIRRIESTQDRRWEKVD